MGDPSEFCDKMTQWARACMEPLPTDNEYTKKWREEFAGHWLWIERTIYKSNLLWRLMYGDEKLRTEQCPFHKGKWSGCETPDRTSCKGACLAGHNVTGWLPNREDLPITITKIERNRFLERLASIPVVGKFFHVGPFRIGQWVLSGTEFMRISSKPRWSDGASGHGYYYECFTRFQEKPYGGWGPHYKLVPIMDLDLIYHCRWEKNHCGVDVPHGEWVKPNTLSDNDA